MNTVNLIGRLTKDIQLKYTDSNIPLVNFTLAVNRQFKNADGEREADFIPCIAWRKAAELLAEHTSKGSQIAVEGRNQTRSYENDGKTVYVMEVVCDSVEFLDTKRERVVETQEEPKKTFTPNQDEDLPF
jgi:single-strand DNA-binding protein